MLTIAFVAASVSCLAALLATGLITIWARRAGFTAPFNPIVPQDRPPAALGGGAALWLGVSGGIAAVAIAGGPSALHFAIALLPALLLGLLDDARPLRPLTKLALQTLAATLAMAALFGISAGAMPLLAGVATAVVLMNAINFLDVSDGFAASISATSFAGLAWLTGSIEALTMAGACLGFLPWNWPPARVYMGDAGGHLLGMAGALLLTGGLVKDGASTAALLFACFGVALAELALLVVVRTRRGVPFWRGSPDHIALRLQRAGVSRAGAARLAVMAQALLILAIIPFAR
jgi:UDP-GlcNAc:undecaprenyl-phosphate GlcNAc-1-phosphate transferase